MALKLVSYDDAAGKIKKPGSSDTVICDGNLTIKDGAHNLDVASHDGTNGFKLAGTLVTAGASEINILDGVTATTAEINYLAGVTLGTSEASKVVTADSSGNVILAGTLTVNGGTTTINSTTVTVDDPIFTLGGDTAPGSDDNKDRGIEFRYHNGSAAKVGFFGFDDSESKFTFIADATNSSEVFSGTAGDVVFGAGSFTNVTASGAVQFGSISDGVITVTAFVDEDNMASDSATLIPTQQSVKAYVDAQVTAQDLDLAGDSGTGSVDLDSQSLTIAGGTNITTVASNQTLTISLDASPVLTTPQINDTSSDHQYVFAVSELTADRTVTLPLLTGNDEFVFAAHTKTLTNKTLDADNNTISNLEVDNLKSGVLDTDLSSVSGSDDTLASAKAIKSYVDSQTGGSAGSALTSSFTAGTGGVSVGSIVSISSGGNVTKAGSSNYEIIGISTEAKSQGQTASIRTTPGGASVTVITEGNDDITNGQVVYASTNSSHYGKCTSTVPTSGTVFRIGYAVADESSGTVSILWMPQFITENG